MSGKPRVIAIVGPTASGKSLLADLVARDLDTSVVSVDAMQVYRGMDIGTAKTPVGERLVDLEMVDIANPDENYSCAQFQADARSCVDGLLAKGKVPVLCGGTGLYLDAVIDEMDFPKGEVEDERRSAYEDYLANNGARALWDLLESRDAKSAAEIHPNNTRRVVRALEMLDEGVSYTDQRAGLRRHEPHYDTLMFGITRDREELYARIDGRVDAMFDAGLVAEVDGLIDMYGSLSKTASQAIGYKEILDARAGDITMDAARELIKRRSRRYAKRQLSWLRRDGRVEWLDMDVLTIDEALDKIEGALR